MRVLVSGPYVGEIGWELMSWQGRVRLRFERGGFERLVVLGAAGRAAFYADMTSDYQEVDLTGLPGEAYEDRRALWPTGEAVPAGAIRALVEPAVEAAAGALRAGGAEVEVLWPEYAGTIYPCEAEGQRFVRFERPCGEVRPAPWVLLVQRTRPTGAANWRAEQWTELAGRLNAWGVNTSIYPCAAEAAIGMACGCDLAVGQSTGGLHLASLCGCPQVGWSVGQGRLWTPWQMTNRQRYETFWNPLGTPVRFYEVGRQPEPAEAAEWVMEGLRTIGRRTGTAAAKGAFRVQWMVRRWLVRHVVGRRSFGRWPWPVQRVVKYEMI